MKQRTQLLLIVIAVLIAFLLASVANAAVTTTNYYVDTDIGSNAYDGLSATDDGGGVGPWETMFYAESERDVDHTVGDGDISIINFAGSTLDTIAVIWDGATTSATQYVDIRRDGEYTLSVANADTMKVRDDYIRFDNMKFVTSATDGDNDHLVEVLLIGATSDIRFTNCIFQGADNDTFQSTGLFVSDATAVVTVNNCLIYDIGQNSFSRGIYSQNGVESGTIYVYNTTIDNCARGVVAGGDVSANVFCKNVIVSNSSVLAYQRLTDGTLEATNCTSDDATVEAFGAGNQNSISPTYRQTPTIYNVIEEGWVGQGLDLSADGQWFVGDDDDYYGTVRGIRGGWDIGFYELPAAEEYYVSNAGNDSSNGITTGTSWEYAPSMDSASNTSDAHVFNPGDTLYFNRGDTWTERFQPADPGTVNNYVTYSAYGSGARPIINVREELTNSQTEAKWVETSGGSNFWVFQDTLTYKNHRLWLEGQDYNQAVDTGPNTAMDSTYRWHNASDVLSVYSVGNPATTYDLIQVDTQGEPNPQSCSILASYIMLNELDLRGGGVSVRCVTGDVGVIIDNCNLGQWSYVAVFADPHDNGIVRNCIIDTDFNAGEYDYERQGGGLGDGIILQDADGWLIHNNVFRGWQHSCVLMQNTGSGTTNNNKCYDNEMDGENRSYSRFFACSAPAEGDCSGNEFYRNYCHDGTVQTQIGGDLNLIDYNIFRDVRTTTAALNKDPTGASRGISIAGTSNTVCLNNSIRNNTFINIAEAGLRMVHTAGVAAAGNIISNNLLFNCGNDSQGSDPAVAIFVNDDNDINTNTWSNNLCYTDGISDIISYRGSLMTIVTFNSADDQSDTIESNITGDPSFVVGSGEDWAVGLSSPAIRMGVTVSGLTTDYNGDPVHRRWPTIGAFEFGSIPYRPRYSGGIYRRFWRSRYNR